MEPRPAVRARGRCPAAQVVLCFRLTLVAAVLCAAAPSQAGIAPSESVVQSTKAEFGKLGLRMVGVATILGDTSVVLSHPGWKDQRTFQVGTSLSGYKIVSIQPGYTIFEKNGVHLWLLVGDGEATPTSKGGEVANDVSSAPARNHKLASADAKVVADAPRTSFRSVNDIRLATGGVRPFEKSNPNEGMTFASSQLDGRFVVPVDGELSSGYGYRKRPMGGASRYHRGVDIAAKKGTPIRAAAAGVVKTVSRNWAKGLFVEVDHGSGYETHYFHMSGSAAKTGQTVRQGQVIGYVGSTGVATGPHLHLELHKNGQPQDPALYIKGLK